MSATQEKHQRPDLSTFKPDDERTWPLYDKEAYGAGLESRQAHLLPWGEDIARTLDGNGSTAIAERIRGGTWAVETVLRGGDDKQTAGVTSALTSYLDDHLGRISEDSPMATSLGVLQIVLAQLQVDALERIVAGQRSDPNFPSPDHL